jgi:hypothetical protein
MLPRSYSKHILSAAYFVFSMLITWWFIAISPLYITTEQMMLSTAIAGGKWGLQIILALLLLKKKKWVFIEHIGFVCLTGSCILLPYIFLNLIAPSKAPVLFIGSLIVAILVMIYYYYKATKETDVSITWWFTWLICLAIAIALQLTVVFHIFELPVEPIIITY